MITIEKGTDNKHWLIANKLLDILVIISSKGGTTQFTKLTPGTITFHLKKLEDLEVIESFKEGRTKSYSLLLDKNEIVLMLLNFRRSFTDRLIDNITEMWDV